MAKTLQQVATELRALQDIPDGYCIEYEDGDHIIVRGPTLGFAVTRKMIQDNHHLAQWVLTLNKLIECEKDAAHGTE